MANLEFTPIYVEIDRMADLTPATSLERSLALAHITHMAADLEQRLALWHSKWLDPGRKFRL